MKIHIVQHESFESPGAILVWAEKNNHSVTFTQLYKGEQLPEDINFDFLIVMGGPQSPDTTIAECPHFDAKKEMVLIKKAIDAGKFVLGVCLGAQLIGESLGAKFDHSPNKEIGVFEVSLTEEGKNDLMFADFPHKFMVGHWHGDMPGLTPESTLLAYSEGCPRQIVRYTPKVYGFQCHFEFNAEAIEGMIVNSTEELQKLRGLPYVENAEELKSHDYSEMNQFLFSFLDKIK